MCVCVYVYVSVCDSIAMARAVLACKHTLYIFGSVSACAFEGLRHMYMTVQCGILFSSTNILYTYMHFLYVCMRATPQSPHKTSTHVLTHMHHHGRWNPGPSTSSSVSFVLIDSITTNSASDVASASVSTGETIIIFSQSRGTDALSPNNGGVRVYSLVARDHGLAVRMDLVQELDAVGCFDVETFKIGDGKWRVCMCGSAYMNIFTCMSFERFALLFAHVLRVFASQKTQQLRIKILYWHDSHVHTYARSQCALTPRRRRFGHAHIRCRRRPPATAAVRKR